MEKVEIYQLQRWGWDCPKCGTTNEGGNLPFFETSDVPVCCNECGTEFEGVNV